MESRRGTDTLGFFTLVFFTPVFFLARVPRGLLCAALLLVAGLGPGTAEGQTADRVADLEIVLDEARAALAILDIRAEGRTPSEADWQLLWDSRGFQRLEARQESMDRPGTQAAVQEYLMGDDALSRREEYRAAIERWRTISAAEPLALASLYLPAGLGIRATVYPVIKHTTNSFVFDLGGDPSIFFSIGSFSNADELTNVMAHELHHVGSSQCAEPPGIDTLPPGPRGAVQWLSAFGEGIAMLAAAGSPDVHPHATSPADAWLVWERDIARSNDDLVDLIEFFRGIMTGSIPEEDQRARLFSFIAREDVPQGAFYTVGWKMAAIVERTAGRDRVVAAVCDPRVLLAEYNSAVSQVAHEEGAVVLWPEELLSELGAPVARGRTPEL